MDTKLLEFALVLALLSSLFTTASGDCMQSHGSIVYNRGQLLVLRHTAVLPDKRPDIHRELRRKSGCCAGVLRRAKRRRYRPVLPSIIMGNHPPCSSLTLTMAQVRNKLRKIKVRKATGPDGISATLW
ncbi:hypothetical protein SRHO_G00098560 [Serrasalmus rhombeus]